MIYTSVYFTMIYKDSQKLEKTRKHRKPMPVNQRVLGSSPSSGAKSTEEIQCFFHLIYIPHFLKDEMCLSCPCVGMIAVAYLINIR